MSTPTASQLGSSAQPRADLNSPRSEGLGAGGLRSSNLSSRRRPGRGVTECGRGWCLPRRIRGAACQSLRRAEPQASGVTRPEQVSGGHTRGATSTGSYPPARPPRRASGGRTAWRRRPEREVGVRGRGKVGASPPPRPGQPPSPSPGQSALGLGPARGLLLIPRVRSAGAKHASLAGPSFRRGG